MYLQINGIELYFCSSFNKLVFLINKKKVSKISITEYPLSYKSYNNSIPSFNFPSIK